MESDKIEMCKTLIEWMKTLNLKSPHTNASVITDGVAIAEALNQIAPEFFSGKSFKNYLFLFINHQVQ